MASEKCISAILNILGTVLEIPELFLKNVGLFLKKHAGAGVSVALVAFYGVNPVTTTSRIFKTFHIAVAFLQTLNRRHPMPT